ncbi:MAG: tRNA (adenosine(37)-N6)-threonylcarbamoyltransferase complex dimerization subunit type 1 TsaB, partial [Verrucomicrobiota bacterium]
MILGIECSTPEGSLAVCDWEGNLIEERSFASHRAHNAVIFEPLESILDEYRDQLEGIAVGIGPGSYGGVRVAISVANGLSLVFGVPVVDVSSIAALSDAPGNYLVAGDARRATYFVAKVENRDLAEEPELLPEIEAIERLSTETHLPAFSSDPKVVDSVESV